MKHKVLALIIALTVVSWAQTETQTPTTGSQQSAEKGKSACCEKMAANGKHHAACMRKHDAKETASCCEGKDEKSCCAGKDAKSSMKDDKNTTANCNNCCGKEKDKAASASCCDHKNGKACCKGCGGTNKSEKPA